VRTGVRAAFFPFLSETLLILNLPCQHVFEKGLEALVPQPSRDVDRRTDYKIVVVQVLDDNHLKINEDSATWDNLGEQLNNIFKLRAEKVAFLKGEDTVAFADVARAIDIMRSSGVEKVGLMTSKLEAGQ
jgi:biopolymer transport protein TolR